MRVVTVLAERNRIAELGDKGILNGNREAYDELIHISSTHSNESIKSTAFSEAGRIKGFWAGIFSLRGWFTTTRLEIVNWTPHGTNYFLGSQCGLGLPRRQNG